MPIEGDGEGPVVRPRVGDWCYYTMYIYSVQSVAQHSSIAGAVLKATLHAWT